MSRINIVGLCLEVDTTEGSGPITDNQLATRLEVFYQRFNSMLSLMSIGSIFRWTRVSEINVCIVKYHNYYKTILCLKMFILVIFATLFIYCTNDKKYRYSIDTGSLTFVHTRSSYFGRAYNVSQRQWIEFGYN